MALRQWVIVMAVSVMSLGMQLYCDAEVIPSETFDFQNGVDGYGGGVDTSIYATSFYENAVNAGRLRVQRSDGDEHANTLVRFEGLDSSLAGVQIEQAFITLRFQLENPKAWTRAIVDVFEIQRDWSDSATWSSAENGEPDPNWVLAGVQDVSERGILSSSLDMGSRFLISGSNFLNYDDEQVFEFELNPAVVEDWANNPASNYGVLLVMQDGTNSDVLFSSSEDETLDTLGLSMKPKLTVITTEICPGISAMDLSGDHFVNYDDFSILEIEWLTTYGPAELAMMAEDWLVALHPDINGDGFVDYFDFQILNSGWQVCYDIEQLAALAEGWLTCTDGSSHPNCIPEE